MVTPLTLANITTPPTSDEWNAAEFALATTLGLPTTAMQQGQIERTIFAVVANLQQQSDIAASLMIQAGFLDFAATGFVTYTALDGSTVTQYVTPDPSIPAQNPTAALGWLDVLADSLYDVQRILSTFAGGTEAIVNTSASTYGPFLGGTYHVSQPGVTGAPGYTNTASLTIPPTSPLGGGALSSVASAGGLIEITTAAAHGLVTGGLAMVVGVTGITQLTVPYRVWVITKTSSTTFTLQGSTFSGSWGANGSAYAPQLAAFSADLPGSASSAAAANLVTQSVTSLIGVSVTNTAAWIGDDIEGNIALRDRCKLKLLAIAVGAPGGAYAYYALLSQQLAPQLSPPETLSAAITRVRVDLDILTAQVFVTVAAAGGTVGSMDLGVVNDVIVAYAGIASFTATARSAVANNVTVVAKYFAPSAYLTTTNDAYFSGAILDYFRSLPIAGVTDAGGATPNTNVVPYDAVVGAVFRAATAANIPLTNVDLTLNGATLNVQLALSPVPEVAVPAITVTH